MKRKREVVILRGHEVKSREWVKALRSRGVNARLTDNYMTLLLELMGMAPKAIARGDLVIFRSLNDRPGIGHTLLVTVLSVACALLARIRRVKVGWICHNVNDESFIRIKYISRARRRAISKLSQVIFVTDELLQRRLHRILPDTEKKTRVLPLGNRPLGSFDWRGGNIDLRDLADARMRTLYGVGLAARHSERVYLGLCAGHPGAKYLHFHYATRLVHAAAEQRINVLLVVVGRLSEGPERLNDRQLNELAEHPQIVFMNRFVPLNEQRLTDTVDFIWRGYADWSTPHSLMSAMHAQIPVLSLRAGVVWKMVERYKLGATVSRNMGDVSDAFERLSNWDSSNALRYVEERTWDAGAATIISFLESEQVG